MPLNFSKGFQRRRSGNALEELANPPQPSFRVFERPTSKSFDAGNTLKRMSQGRPLSAGPQLEENRLSGSSTGPGLTNRGSGGTNNSASSGGHNDNSSASARFSSSSTLPSSTDVPLDEKPLPVPKDAHHIPIPPIPQPNPLSLRAAGRTFSFGRKKAQSPSTPANMPQSTSTGPNSRGYASVTRERAMTESSYTSGSTATPPKLLDSDLDLGESDLDGLGNMFESFGKRKSQLIGGQEILGLETTESPKNMSPTGSKPPMKSYFSEQLHNTPSPTPLDRPHEVESSPYSWSSRSSQDGLIHPSSPMAVKLATNPYESSSTPKYNRISIASRTMPVSDPNSPSHRPRMQRPPSTAGAGLRRSSAYSSPRDSDTWQDEDARLVMDSVHVSRRLNRQLGGLSPYRDDESEVDTNPTSSLPRSSTHPFPSSATMGQLQKVDLQNGPHSPVALFDSNDQEFHNSTMRLESLQTTPRAKQLNPVLQTESALFGTSPTSSRFPLPPRPQILSTITKAGGQNKVMTPAQFNEYKKEQEMTRSKIDASNSGESDDENDNYEDDDEAERNKQLARQRRKQEAHLAVYRQQMMKMTGEQPSNLPIIGQTRPGAERASASAPDLSGRYATPSFSFDKPTNKGKGSDDEDEDVPLGILAAHGFPSKNRPPTIFGNGILNPNINYTSESYPPPPVSMVGTSNAAGGKRLPPFARNLPPDPYYGAGLVNPSNRESLAFGTNNGGSMQGGYAPNPAGLVGVIAGEERARAMRRGSPNSQGNYGYHLPQGMPQAQMSMPPGMMPMPMMTPGDEAQVQMSQQMSQMMQMQMQWMQQMQQMVSGGIQGQQFGPQSGQPQLMQQHQQQMMSHSFLAPPDQSSRPISVGSHSAPSTPAMGIQSQQRTMSMITPSTGPQWPSNGNVRLTAPSIMSGGLGGQGYTPSIAPSERSTVGMPSRYRPVSIAPIDEAPRPGSRASTLMSEGLQTRVNRQSTLATSIKPVQSSRQKGFTASDDDDDEGWQEMKQNREKKKSSWRPKRNDDHDIHDMYYPEA